MVVRCRGNSSTDGKLTSQFRYRQKAFNLTPSSNGSLWQLGGRRRAKETGVAKNQLEAWYKIQWFEVGLDSCIYTRLYYFPLTSMMRIGQEMVKTRYTRPRRLWSRVVLIAVIVPSIFPWSLPTCPVHTFSCSWGGWIGTLCQIARQSWRRIEGAPGVEAPFSS